MNHIAQLSRTASTLLLATLVGACDAPPDDFEELEDQTVADDDVEFRIGTLTTGRRMNTNHSGNHWFSP